jgi:hypothetical protein
MLKTPQGHQRILILLLALPLAGEGAPMADLGDAP